MTGTLTLRETAELFNDLDGVSDPQEREGRYQKLRPIVQAGMVTSDVAVSKGKTAAFSAAKIAQLRLLQALVDSGFKGTVLWRFNAHLTKTPLVAAAGNRPGTEIALAAEGIAAGEEWEFIVAVTRSLISGDIQCLGGLRKVGTPQSSSTIQILAAGRVTYSVVTIPASDLIRPVLDRLAELAQ